MFSEEHKCPLCGTTWLGTSFAGNHNHLDLCVQVIYILTLFCMHSFVVLKCQVHICEAAQQQAINSWDSVAQFVHIQICSRYYFHLGQLSKSSP